MNKKEKLPYQKGFTIVELMIATAVVSMIIVLVSMMMIKIGNLYYKGINQAGVQDNTRNVADDVARHLELNDNQPIFINPPISFGVAHIQAYCINTNRYTFIEDKQVKSGSIIKHILWRDTVPADSCTPADLTSDNPSIATGGTNGTELVEPNAFLTYFCIMGSGPSPTCNNASNSPYSIQIGLAYAPGVAFGSNGLLNGPGLGISTTCRGSTGDQFCATSSLVTTVAERIQ